MHPTRRGLAVLTVALGAVVLAWLAGARALNAVAAPLLAAVLAGAVQVHRAGTPTVERSRPVRGFPGERKPVDLSVDGRGVAHVTDTLGDGLSGSPAFERSLPTTVTYDVHYDRRGRHRIGPAQIDISDVLGLVRETVVDPQVTEVLVYPRVHTTEDVGALLGTGASEAEARSAFDHLREYAPGDPVRDIDWKTTAKHDELLVTEYDDPRGADALSVVARARPGHADEMASATATLVVAAIDRGHSVAMTLPDGDLPPGRGDAHRRRALELLADTDGGEVPDAAWDAADLRVHADEDGVSVEAADRRYDLEDLTLARSNPLRVEVGG